MQLLCYEGTLKETKWQAVKSKGVVLVFRMFRLDGRLPKDRSRWGPLLYEIMVELRQETTWGGCDVTNGDIWWYLLDLAGKLATAWPRSRWNTGCRPSGSPRPREGTRADGWSSVGWSLVGKSGRPWHIYLFHGPSWVVSYSVQLTFTNELLNLLCNSRRRVNLTDSQHFTHAHVIYHPVATNISFTLQPCSPVSLGLWWKLTASIP